MARGGRAGYKHTQRNGVNFKKRRLEDSDEDYNVSGDEVYESEDGYCSSLQADTSSSEFEEEWVEKKANKVGRSGLTQGSKRRKINTVLDPRKKKVAYDDDDDDVVNVKRRKINRLSHSKEEEDDYEILRKQKKDGYGGVKTRRKPRVVHRRTQRDGFDEKRRKKSTVLYLEEEDEFNDSEDLTPDENDMPSSKKNKTKRSKRKGQVSKRTQNNRPVRKRVLCKKHRSGTRNKVRSSTVRKKKIIARDGGRSRTDPTVDSDSGSVNSGSSDYEFTISEEEREQVREAMELSRRLASSIRSSNSLKVNKEENFIIRSQRDQPERKGKEKVVDTELKGQQVCGICLSGEGKRTIRGILSCCSHYFCFNCIIEWSKVESRCPLCKQRFSTISRSAHADSGLHPRDVAIAVPKRDQVYQPSEEEVRGFLDPYASVICSECQQGCDDALMLLCDLCDSSAHTYCVGLGHEVPEGNWYCNACRPTVLASSNEQPVNLVAPNNLGSSSIAADQESSYYTSAYAPEICIGQLAGQSRPTRDFIGYSQVISPPGSGAATLLGRRRIQRHIHQFMNNRNIVSERCNAVTPISSTSSLGAQVCEQDLVQVSILPNSIYHQGRLIDCTMTSRNSREIHTPNLSSADRLGFCNQASTSANHSTVGLLSGGFSGINASVAVDLGQQRLQSCSIQSSTGVNSDILPPQLGEVDNPGVTKEQVQSIKKEQVQSMVKNHLKCLSRDKEIGYNTFKDIARTSTHTVLAAFGHEHRPKEVYRVRAQPLICNHHHPEGLTNQPISLNREQCNSCLDRFVKSVVEEVLCVRVATPCINQTIQEE